MNDLIETTKNTPTEAGTWISNGRKSSRDYDRDRKQNRRITIRMVETDYEKIQKQVEKSKLTQTEFAVKCMLDKNIIVVDGAKEIAKKFGSVGNNINQLARISNSTGSAPSVQAVNELRDEVIELWRSLKQLIVEPR